MTQTITNNKIKFIPTELNAFTYLKHKYIKQQKTIKSLCKWLFVLILWNLLITGFICYSNIEHIPEPLEVIENIQDFEPLTIDEFEVIGD